MPDGQVTMTTEERALLGAARTGDEDAYRRLVAPRHAELHAHCYRMLGSVHDAEDALQEALLRAWRGLERFEGRSSLRSWLYRIATNTCLDAAASRERRVLPIDYGPSADPHDSPGAPLTESVWIEPYPDAELDVEQRESVELAFVAARATVEARLPERSQQETLRALDDARLRALVEQYAAALQSGDVERVVALLTEDAAWSMPPCPGWFRGREAVVGFLAGYPLQERWRHVPTRANGQLAVGCFMWNEETGRFDAAVLDVLTLEGERIAQVTGFIAPWVYSRFGEAEGTMTPDAFARFGLPEHVEA